MACLIKRNEQGEIQEVLVERSVLPTEETSKDVDLILDSFRNRDLQSRDQLQEDDIVIIAKSMEQLEQENRSTYPKIPSENVFLNEVEPLTYKETSQVSNLIEQGRESEFPIASVNVRNIIPTQKFLEADNLERTQDVIETQEPIILLKYKDKYYVIDGHHRIANEILKGQVQVETRIYDVEAELQKEISNFNEFEIIDSQLFRNISSLPLVNSLDSALDIYKNIYSTEFLESFGDWKTVGNVNSNLIYDTGEPKMFFLTPNGFVTESYEEALKNTSDGDIKIGVIGTSDVFVVNSENQFTTFTNDVIMYNGKTKLNDRNKFIEMASISSNSDPTTVQGFINYGIRQDKIDERRRRVNNEYLLQGKGALESSSILNSQLVLWDGISFLGKEVISRNSNGTFVINESDSNRVMLPNSEGELVAVSKDNIISDLRNGRYRDLSSRYPV